jgi:hypothetical protein
MNVLIIGGDNLESILYKLHEKGFNNIEHVSGRKGWNKKMNMLVKSQKVDLVIILVDFINHCVVKNTKEKLKNSNIKTIFSKRSWVHLESHLDKSCCN